MIEKPWMRKCLDYVKAVENCNKRGFVMLGFPDYFNLARLGSDEDLKSIQKEINNSWIIASPIIYYNHFSNIESIMVHNYGSKLVKQKINKAIIPNYKRRSLEKVLDTDVGLKFFQALSDSRAGKKTIIRTMERLSDITVSKICLRSIGDYVGGNPFRPVSFGCNPPGFSFGGDMVMFVSKNMRGRFYAVPKNKD